MRIAFLASDKAREQHLADAFLMGARKHGHATEVITLTGESFVGGYDVACMVGVKSKALFHAHRQAGVTTIYLDKGYARHKRPGEAGGWEYWRVSINAHHPTRRLGAEALPHDRVLQLDLALKPWRTEGHNLLFAGSSAKYHEFYGLREPNEYARRVIRTALPFTGKRSWIYRPKPSWAGGEPIKNARFSCPPDTIGDALRDVWCTVTHGSNACFESVLNGVPVIVLGDAVAKPISSTTIDQLRAPRLASDAERWQWLANLSWWQWKLSEFASGEAWAFLGEQIHAA